MTEDKESIETFIPIKRTAPKIRAASLKPVVG